MRIGLYGMPTAGKSFILNQLDFIEVIHGSRSLHTMYPHFDLLDTNARQNARKAFATKMMEKEMFIMDGHFAFGDEIAFTENDGNLFDAFLYLYISPAVLESRMSQSVKNEKYLRHDIDQWQNQEILCLRDYCHRNGKDFYVLDNPPVNEFGEIAAVKDFIRAIVEGYSCAAFAKTCASEILHICSDSDTIVLTDGDKTLTLEDSSREVFGYSTQLYDGNFYRFSIVETGRRIQALYDTRTIVDASSYKRKGQEQIKRSHFHSDFWARKCVALHLQRVRDSVFCRN